MHRGFILTSYFVAEMLLALSTVPKVNGILFPTILLVDTLLSTPISTRKLFHKTTVGRYYTTVVSSIFESGMFN